MGVDICTAAEKQLDHVFVSAQNGVMQYGELFTVCEVDVGS